MEAKEKLLWSIALPGFGQILNGKYIKGLAFILLEIIINIQSNLNEVILLSFNGEIDRAIQSTDYQWLMFYPCLYFFAMWDAFKDGGGGKKPYSFLPFVISAYLLTLGVIYSARITIFDYLLGPVLLPILLVTPGVFIGLLLKKLLNKKDLHKEK